MYFFGVISFLGCVNFALKMVVNDNEFDFGLEVVNFIRKDFYVDDGLIFVELVYDAVTLIKDIKEMCRRGGFKLYKIILSYKEVIEVIFIEDRVEGI